MPLAPLSPLLCCPLVRTMRQPTDPRRHSHPRPFARWQPYSTGERAAEAKLYGRERNALSAHHQRGTRPQLQKAVALHPPCLLSSRPDWLPRLRHWSLRAPAQAQAQAEAHVYHFLAWCPPVHQGRVNVAAHSFDQTTALAAAACTRSLLKAACG